MAYGDKTTKAGLGDVKRDKSTRAGLPIDRKKIVTKRGMSAPPVPPIEAPIPTDVIESAARDRELGKTNPRGMTPPPPLEQMQLDESHDSWRQNAPSPEAPVDLTSEQARVAANEDVTPAEGSPLDDPEDRSRFRTAPGGGRNRISGGREHASAYVSPTTLKPGTGNTPVTAAVKVLDVVESAVRAYKTEPSLLKRRLSSMPPPINEHQRRSYLIAGGVAIGLVLGAMTIWLGARQSRLASKENAGPVAEIPPASGASDRKSETSRNDPSLGPKSDPKGENTDQAAAPVAKVDPAVTPPTELPEEKSNAKPTRPEGESAVKKPGPAPKASTAPASPKPSNDLWLE